jgi:hypothetical protein
MWQIIKRTFWLWLLASGLQSSWAFSLGGPFPPNANSPDGWEQPVIGYQLGGDINTPKNIGEEYRRNTPVMYWTFDANFAGYFGSNGVVALRGAYAALNALTNADNYSQSLSEFPTESRHQNYKAQTLGLLDLKSWTLSMMVEQLGLCDPVRYAWTLHARSPGNNCPTTATYLVVQRNFDIFNSPLNQVQYSPYVNNTLYSYTITEFCAPPNPLAVTVPFSVDPLADIYSPVASLGAIYWGEYYTGLTRDDVAGLRYLFTTNNINWETPAPAASLLTTNLGLYTFITSSNLNLLLVASQTNPPGTIPTLFPGVTVTAATTNFVVVATPNVSSSFTINNGQPYPGVPVLTVVTNGYTYTPMFVYQDTFGGILTNANLTNTPNIVVGSPSVVLSYYTNTPATVVTVSLAPLYGAPYPPPAVTNTTTQSIILTNAASGEYLTLPTTTNQCGWNIISLIATNVVVNTNVITLATNTTTTNAVGFVGSVSVVTYFTNHTFLVQPINCLASATNPPGLYEGIGQVQFVEADYDSLLGQFFRPVTNNYTMTMVTNSQTVVQHFRRVVTAPDFLFTAVDSGTAPLLVTRNLNFNQANILAGLAGPGTIEPSTTITLNKSGPLYFNATADTLDGTPYFTELPGSDILDLFYSSDYFLWASYDGTTNDPVVYPNGTSIQNLENQALIRLYPAALPGGFSDVAYGPVTISAAGGAFTQPYTWSAAGLPSGLTLVFNADSTAALSGTPTQSGTFDFTLTLTDYVGRSVQWGKTITIQ